ncbi:hypothetical protein HDU96_007668, partial [Phlyctochytrium bullatum]
MQTANGPAASTGPTPTLLDVYNFHLPTPGGPRPRRPSFSGTVSVQGMDLIMPHDLVAVVDGPNQQPNGWTGLVKQHPTHGGGHHHHHPQQPSPASSEDGKGGLGMMMMVGGPAAAAAGGGGMNMMMIPQQQPNNAGGGGLPVVCCGMVLTSLHD